MVYGTMLEQTVMLMYSCIPFFDRFTPFHSILLYIIGVKHLLKISNNYCQLKFSIIANNINF